MYKLTCAFAHVMLNWFRQIYAYRHVGWTLINLRMHDACHKTCNVLRCEGNNAPTFSLSPGTRGSRCLHVMTQKQGAWLLPRYTTWYWTFSGHPSPFPNPSLPALGRGSRRQGLRWICLHSLEAVGQAPATKVKPALDLGYCRGKGHSGS